MSPMAMGLRPSLSGFLERDHKAGGQQPADARRELFLTI